MKKRAVFQLVANSLRLVDLFLTRRFVVVGSPYDRFVCSVSLVGELAI